MNKSEDDVGNAILSVMPLAGEVVLKNRKQIDISTSKQQVAIIAGKIANEVKNKHTMFYRPDIGAAVELVTVQKRLRGTCQRETSDELQVVAATRFVTYIDTYVKTGVFVKSEDGKTLEFVEKSISPALAKQILDSAAFTNSLFIIDNIITAPLPVLHDGKIMFPERGYDKRFETWLSRDAPIIDKEINLNEAKVFLTDVYKECCFSAEQDYVNALSGLLTPFCRGIYSEKNTLTPAIYYRGNQPNIGKDTCAVVTGITIENTEAQDKPIEDGPELAKKVTAAFVSKRKRMHFANCKGKIQNKDFENLLTNPVWLDRVLGSTNDSGFDNDLDISLSANGSTYSKDLGTRFVYVNLLYKPTDKPRKYTRTDFPGFIRKNRAKILSCLFALVKNWQDNGAIRSEHVNRFAEWSEICGGILEAAGYNSPCNNSADYSTIDATDEDVSSRNFFIKMYEKCPEQELSIADIKEIIKADDEMPFHEDNLLQKSGQMNLVQSLKTFENMSVAGINFVIVGKDKQSKDRRYKLTKHGDSDKHFDMLAFAEHDEKDGS